MKVLFVPLVLLALYLVVGTAATPLDDYINKPDNTFKWEFANSFRGYNYTTFNVKLTSQTWMDPTKVSISVWTHWLQLCVPDVVSGPQLSAIMYIDGGSNIAGGGLGNPPDKQNTLTGVLCATTGTVTAHLGQIPNQPIVFTNDPKKLRRTEDNMIAWTWRNFLTNTSEPEWLARLPMTKAVVRAMDATQQFIASRYFFRVTSFVIAGGSKRGWTTWTAAAVDKRVKAFVPIVMPMGNMTPLVEAMFRVYGEWSFVLDSYVNAEVMGFLGTPEWYKMADVIDPVKYFDRWSTIPKYVISGAGDEFFLPDSAKFWWDQLPHPKFMYTGPNAEHSMVTAPIWDAVLSVDTFFHMVDRKLPLPVFDWKLTYGNSSASITAWASGPTNPKSVWVYQATTLSTTQRDFRLIRCGKPELRCLNPVLWGWKQIQETSPGSRTWTVTVPAPAAGWTGFLIEALYDGGYTDKDPLNWRKELKITTEINVVPDTLPFPPCETTKSCQPPVPWDPNSSKSLH